MNVEDGRLKGDEVAQGLLHPREVQSHHVPDDMPGGASPKKNKLLISLVQFSTIIFLSCHHASTSHRRGAGT